MSTKGELSSKKSKSTTENSLPSSVAFVHNFLDEYGLDPYEFRLYAHIVRRTGGKPQGVCFASLRKTAEICKMSTRKAQQAIKVLINAHFVTQTKRTGRTDEYRVTPVSEWVPKEELDEIRKAIAGNSHKKSVSTEAETKTIES
ncbi:helix-turn-helix domain-containing protein [Calothrix sp. UHCC 0171]|uniref:helix-turn-helix domain-containing protein n=1 Tax=Calothrix sp. UHCC 0171 TaxID=3110245 RepID=UPI002B2168D9|nr:helix-turn-helix domain-containing protein [Calothrix sp. UHCC 0171]MEA5574643.1 helix-turn-helix domain-containing protein [Calothrix sp. UHCC 0171]